MVPRSLRFFESSRPESKFNIVVFPEPEGPKIAVTVLGSNFPEHYLRMVREAFYFLNPPFPLGTSF